MYKFSPTEISQKIQNPQPNKNNFAVAFEKDKLYLELYQPIKKDPQKPHTRDELYFIIEGAGEFEMANETTSFQQGDLIFVPKNIPHKFKNFGESMKCWVVFYD